MTTIATDGQCIVADGLAVAHHEILAHDEVKIFQATPPAAAFGPDIGQPSFFGQAGEWYCWDRVRRWFNDGAPLDKLPDLSEHWCLLQLTHDGDVFYWDDKLVPELRGSIRRDGGVRVCIGSGREVAMGAMLAGAGPKQAVIHASLYDIYTNDNVTVRMREELHAGQMAAE